MLKRPMHIQWSCEIPRSKGKNTKPSEKAEREATAALSSAIQLADTLGRGMITCGHAERISGKVGEDPRLVARFHGPRYLLGPLKTKDPRFGKVE